MDVYFVKVYLVGNMIVVYLEVVYYVEVLIMNKNCCICLIEVKEILVKLLKWLFKEVYDLDEIFIIELNYVIEVFVLLKVFFMEN